MEGTKNFKPRYEITAKMALIHHGAFIRSSIRLLLFLLAKTYPLTRYLIIKLPEEGRPRIDSLFGITRFSYDISIKVNFGV